MLIKSKIENNDKIYEINISDNKQLTINQQIQTFLDNINFEIPDNRIFYALFNTDSNMYMINYDEIGNFKNSTYVIKNCSLEAKNIVSILQNIYNESIGFRSESTNINSFRKSTDLTPGSLASSEYLETGGSRSSISANTRPELKNIVFKLKNYFFVDAFSEEFIAYDGIRVLINLIDNTSGNTRSYAINALKSLLRYENSYGYIQENKEVVEILYNILINYDAMNTATHTLDVLILITNILSDFGVSIIMRSAEIYAMKSNNKIFKELVNFINDSNIDIKLNSLNLICDMLEKCTDKIKKSKLLVALEDVELKATLEKNSDCRSRDFQNFLTKYQLLTGEIIRGSFYEVETYKKKLRELEKHCNELERKTELIFLNQKFNNEIVEDFIHFKKLAEVCSDVGGYYDPYSPVDRYDHRLNRKINVDPNGILNMKKLTEDIRKEDIPRVKTLQNELDSLTNRYNNLKEDFDLINLNNKELKNIFYDKTGKKDSSDNDYLRTKEMEDLKEENKELQKKMDIMVDKLKRVTDENKENEEDIERLKKEIKKYKENTSNRTSFHSDLVPIPSQHIEFTGQKVENNQASVIQKPTAPAIPSIPSTIPPKPPTTPQVPNVPSIPTIPGAPKVPVPPGIPAKPPTTVPSVPGIPVPKVPGPPSVPSVPGVPKVVGPPSVPIPGVPSVPKVSGPPTVPSVPKVPGTPTVPSVPGVPVPKAPGPPSIPSVPGVPKVPGPPSTPSSAVPSVPGVPVPKAPAPPSIPGVPKAPGAPGVPSVPGVPGVTKPPGVPSVPGVPGVPKAPGVPGVPSAPGVPKAPGVPGVPSAPGVPKAPGVPGVPSAPGVPKAPGVPGIPSAPGVPKAPGVPGVPSAPGVAGAPKAPGIQGPPGVPNGGAPVAQQPQPVVFKPVVTKKEIKLEKKVKGVTWNRILLMPKEAPNRVETVWDSIKEVKVDIDEIANLFEVKTAAPIVNKEDSSKPPEIKKKKFLSDKRAQSVGIGLAKCPAIDRIENALKNMDLDLLPKQLVLNLNREYMTEEEVGIYETLNSLPGDWEKQEDLLIKIRNIDSSREKLQIWSFFFEVEDQLDNIEYLVSAYRGAFKKVRESDPLKKVISYILTFGNILNGGTPKGQADGFNLDILTKLTTVKDNSNKTLLQIVCMKIKSEDEDFKPMKKSFECIEESLKVPSMETKGTIDKYLKQAEGNKAVLDKLSVQDSFSDKAGKTLESYISRLKKLDDDYKSNLEYAQKTVEYFGYAKSDAKYKKPDDFLQLINDFLGDLDKSIPVTEAKKAFKGTAEMGKKITDNKNPAFNSVLSGLKNKLGNNN